jgi:hypothetical protein
VPADYAERVGRLVAEGHRDQAVEVFMTEAIGMTADPSWEKMTRYAHTLAYDGRIVQGTQDGARALVELLPRASCRVLAGQDHSAFWMAPDAVAGSVAGFLQATAC